MNYIIRVDDRLVHGQVVEGWIKPLKIEQIVICSDISWCDPFEKNLFEISIPKHVKLECSSIEVTANNIISRLYNRISTLILISSLEELYNLVVKVREILPDYIFPPINIGGIRYCGGRKQFFKALCLNKDDFNILKKLHENNIILEYYLLPLDNKIILNNILDDIEKNL